MATAVIMPRQGQSVESCIIGKWHKQKGDTVNVGDLLFTYETDKATFDETSKVSGILLDVFFGEGDDVPCLTNVCVIGQPGEDTSELRPGGAGPGKPEAAAETGPSAVMEPEAQAPQGLQQGDEAEAAGRAASPRARSLAERSGADLRMAEGSGPHGRIIEKDVQALISAGKMATKAAGGYAAGIEGTGLGGRVSARDAEAQPRPPVAAVSDEKQDDVTIVKHSMIRKVIAKTMQSSLSNMAQLTLNASFDASDILSLRSRLKTAAEQASGDGGRPVFVPTLNDIILFAASRVLPRHPSCNAHYDEDKLTCFRHVHLGVAVDTPRGLMVPTLFSADRLTITEISGQVRDLSSACQKGTINPDALKGGTFTVTNLGTLDVESFTPVINPPQTCILGVCGIVTRVRGSDGQISAYPAIGLSLTFDHRAVDGAPAARFLKELRQVLENFSTELIRGGMDHV